MNYAELITSRPRPNIEMLAILRLIQRERRIPVSIVIKPCTICKTSQKI